jgi:hypothetical protein
MDNCINIGELQFWFQFLLRTNLRYLDWRMTLCCALSASSTVSVPGGDEREQEGKVRHRKGWRGGGAPGRGDGVAPSCRKVVASPRSDASSVAGSGEAKATERTTPGDEAVETPAETCRRSGDAGSRRRPAPADDTGRGGRRGDSAGAARLHGSAQGCSRDLRLDGD